MKDITAFVRRGVSVLPVSAWRRVGAVLLAGTVGVLALWYFTTRLPPIPRRALRIGFEPNPPVQIRTDNGFSGLAVDTVNEAARRAGIKLHWVETGTSSDAAFQKGLVDLWPLMADLPERRKRIHVTQPWLRSNYVLLFRAASVPLDRKFTGEIAVFRMPIHAHLVGAQFPEARVVQLNETKDILKRVCRGTVSAAFLAARVAETTLREQPAECASVGLRVQVLPDMIFQGAVGSTFAAAGAAEAIRREIGGLFRDGTLAVLMAKYSYYGLENDWATLDLMQAAEHARWMAWGIGGLGIVLALTLWRVSSLRQRKRAEGAIRASEERFRRVFEEGPLGLGLVGRDYRFEKVNRALCQMLEYSEAELLQRSFVDLTHPDDVRQDVELAERLFRREIPFYQMRKRYVKKNGEIVWINLTASLIRDQDGEPLHGLAMIEDISELKRTQEDSLARHKMESLGVLAGWYRS